MSDFQFHEHELEQLAKATVERTLQHMMDRLQQECRGKSVEETKRRLGQAREDAPDADITDPELTAYATELAAGKRVIITLT
ncbi:hypothetical protein FND50_34790 [Rhodococcus sp. WB9]|uniref:hypothetical protein n=1 Tax=Rhodococcus sp. WB9 TaxID=2594007 RepID=UPI001185D3F1|nr:hypothetical protein [Rhodococcus sp. WB9]QDQ95380.1 hypothetical protein FND50_34790 [Rhodococcus sp. WB9]